MKKKKINLSVIKEIMSVKDLKNTLGGSGGNSACNGLPSGEGCKTKACEDKKNGDKCKFCYNDKVYNGKCANDVFWGQLYCCDLC